MKEEKIVADKKLVRMILKKRPYLNKKDVEAMLTSTVSTNGKSIHCIYSTKLALVTGRTSENLITMSKNMYIKKGQLENKLTRVFPFETSEPKEKTKLMFILMDEKAKTLIFNCNK